jgi:hypothetical protein
MEFKVFGPEAADMAGLASEMRKRSYEKDVADAFAAGEKTAQLEPSEQLKELKAQLAEAEARLVELQQMEISLTTGEAGAKYDAEKAAWLEKEAEANRNANLGGAEAPPEVGGRGAPGMAPAGGPSDLEFKYSRDPSIPYNANLGGAPAGPQGGDRSPQQGMQGPAGAPTEAPGRSSMVEYTQARIRKAQTQGQLEAIMQTLPNLEGLTPNDRTQLRNLILERMDSLAQGAKMKGYPGGTPGYTPAEAEAPVFGAMPSWTGKDATQR